MEPAAHLDLADLLVRLARSPGDRDAWAELYGRLWPFVFATNYRLLRGQQALAEDVSQEVFLRLQRYCPFGRLTEPATFRRYLAAVCRNACRTYLRQTRRRGEVAMDDVLEGLGGELPADPQLEEQVSADDLLRELLAQLDDEDRKLLRLMIEGHSLREIAAQTNLTYSNTGVRVFRLRRRLKKLLAGGDAP